VATNICKSSVWNMLLVTRLAPTILEKFCTPDLHDGGCSSLRNITIIYLFTAIGLSPGGSGYFTCIQNVKLVTTRFKPGGLHEKHVVATWNLGNRLSICL